MKIIFVGMQGSGKGTQAKIIAEKLGICHISTGDLLRNASGDLKKEVDLCMNSGKLVSDELMIKILKEKLNSKECSKGFILDGFPRNIKQAEELDKIAKIDKIIEIEISDEEAVKRLSSRLSCKKCGEVYNINTNPPKINNICDKCSCELYARKDDNEEAIRTRLKIYHEETLPILSHYNSVKINGEQTIENVTRDILKIL